MAFNVEYEGRVIGSVPSAGGKVITLPCKDKLMKDNIVFRVPAVSGDGVAELIEFTVDGYNAGVPSGFSWREFLYHSNVYKNISHATNMVSLNCAGGDNGVGRCLVYVQDGDERRMLKTDAGWLVEFDSLVQNGNRYTSQPNTILFSIDGKNYIVEKGLTWVEFAQIWSDVLNSYNYKTGVVYAPGDASFTAVITNPDGTPVHINDVIVESEAYKTAETPHFKFEGNSLVAGIGMTWEEFFASNHFTDSVLNGQITASYTSTDIVQITKNGQTKNLKIYDVYKEDYVIVRKTDRIVDGGVYVYSTVNEITFKVDAYTFAIEKGLQWRDIPNGHNWWMNQSGWQALSIGIRWDGVVVGGIGGVR